MASFCSLESFHHFCFPALNDGSHYLIILSINIALLSMLFLNLFEVAKHSNWGLATKFHFPIPKLSYIISLSIDVIKSEASMTASIALKQKNYYIKYSNLLIFIIFTCFFAIVLTVYQILRKTNAMKNTIADNCDLILLLLILLIVIEIIFLGFASVYVIRQFYHDLKLDEHHNEFKNDDIQLA